MMGAVDMGTTLLAQAGSSVVDGSRGREQAETDTA